MGTHSWSVLVLLGYTSEAGFISAVPAGVNQDDEFVPQAGIAYRQLDLSKGTLMVPNDPVGIANICNRHLYVV